MRRNIFILVLFLISGCFISSVFAQGRDDEDIDTEEASYKAAQAHELSDSDVIYQQQDFKALYYQNLQIIQLLKEIRDSLEFIKTRNSLETDEKSA